MDYFFVQQEGSWYLPGTLPQITAFAQIPQPGLTRIGAQVSRAPVAKPMLWYHDLWILS